MAPHLVGNLSAGCGATRLRFGVIFLAVSLIGAATVAHFAVPWGYRLLLFVPFYLAASGFLQGLFGT
jgi:hypothetical protein